MGESLPAKTDQIVVFSLDELLYALSLHAVVRVIHAVDIRFLPGAPEIISGIINMQGRIIPVINIRKRFGLGERDIDLNDHMIIVDTGKRKVALLADTVTGIRNLAPGQQRPAIEYLPFAKYLRGVTKIEDGLILIYDLEQFLSLDEEKELEEALITSTR
jgi:purine-binding chemotaxis protein CheW